MIKYTVRRIALLLLFVLAALGVYMYPSAPKFPDPPPDALQSFEPADSETPLRRAYFTNYTREQVIAHYENQFGYRFPLTIRLNYPPENAYELIRDQTRSTYLEELVHPLRESLFINGFEPREAKDDIWYQGQHFEQKITVKYNHSTRNNRLVLSLMITLGIYLLLSQYSQELLNLPKFVKNKFKNA